MQPDKSKQLREVSFRKEPKNVEAESCAIFLSKSLPRSGHHFLVKLLRAYFGQQFAYCEFYVPRNCCKKMPCSQPFNKARSNRYFLQKSHDFDLSDPVDPAQRYFVEYRHPIPRIQSNFELALKNGARNDCPEDFWSFAEKEIEYQIGFYWKWIHDPLPGALLLPYERLRDATRAELTRILLFMTGDKVDADKVESSIDCTRGINVHSKSAFQVRNPWHHRFFDASLARAAEQRVFEECPRLDIPRIFD